MYFHPAENFRSRSVLGALSFQAKLKKQTKNSSTAANKII